MERQAERFADRFYVRPSAHVVDLTAEALAENRLAPILRHLRGHLVAGNPALLLADIDEMEELATSIDGLALPVADKFRLACAPVSMHRPAERSDLVSYATAIARGGRARPPAFARGPWGATLEDLEAHVSRLSLYLSVSRSFPRHLPDGATAEQERADMSARIADTLRSDAERNHGRFRSRHEDWW